MTEVKPGILEATVERIVLVAELPVAHDSSKAVQRFGLKPERLADFASGKSTTIRNNIRSHGGTALTVALVDMLDHTFALIAARKIQIDIRPFTTLFGEKAFEKKVHLDGIDCRDAKRVTHCTVRR